MGDRLAALDMVQKLRDVCVPFEGGAGSPSTTMWR